MIKYNRKGFTLVELLAVIVILAIILAIAFPTITSLISTSIRNGFESDAKLIIKAIDYKKLEDPSFDETTITESNITSLLGISSDNIETLSIALVDGVRKITITGQGEWDGLVACGSYMEMKVVNSIDECTIAGGGSSDWDTAQSLHKPNLGVGMIPIYYDDSNMVWKKADENNGSNQWYNYASQQWANAVLVSNSTRTTYQNATVGTEITEADVLAYIVWIPRYKYKLFNVESSIVSPQAIEVTFENKTDTKSNGTVNNQFLTHPAFTFGNTELAGIWVGKFELTGNTTTPTVKPNLTTLGAEPVSTLYNTIRKMDATVDTGGTYGLTTSHDAHMMKNMEWGAVAYLSHSIYGKYGNNLYTGNNKEIYTNNSSLFKSGKSMGAVGGSGIKNPDFEFIDNGYYTYDGKCSSIYAGLPAPCNSGSIGQVLTDKTLSYGASTTGNIYGIYDISGGAWEYVMGALYNSNNTTVMVNTSGFDQATIDDPNNAKYIDKYTYGTSYNDQTAFNRRQLGDATGETLAWYGDLTYFIYNSQPWSARGGRNGINTKAGAFSFSYNGGLAVGGFTTRLVIS